MLINIAMTKAVRGARPIKNLAIKQHYDNHVYRDVSLDEYAEVWRNWLNYSDTKVIKNLDRFDYADYTQGTSQTFDNFVLKHAVDKEIFCLKGDFQYHACLGKHVRFKYVKDYNHLINSIQGRGLHALIISAPFSDYGCVHPEFYDLLNLCEINNFPVCVDLAYWGIAKNIELDLGSSAIKEVTCSLSKPFYALENHRVGIRFTTTYSDDGISMLNEVNMQNKHSMSLGVHFMKSFGPDWNWETYQDKYEQVCEERNLVYTDTVIFGLGGKEYKQFNRGVPNNNRVCISEYLEDTDI
jgi:hypothetical protein